MGEPAWPRSRNDETSRGRAHCSTTNAASIVGTGKKKVTRSRSITSRHNAGSNSGVVTVVPPSQTRPVRGAMPATWNIAGAPRKTSSLTSEQATILLNALATRLRCVSITPFGKPVVPPGVKEPGNITAQAVGARPTLGARQQLFVVVLDRDHVLHTRSE